MQYLKLENVSKSYGDKVLFQDINLSISQGQKIALIAKNGSGKTTLLKVIAGEEAGEGERANILVAKDIKIAYLRQDPQYDPESSILETVFDSDNPSIQAVRDYEHALLAKDNAGIQKAVSKIDDLKAWDIEVRIKEILSKLGINDLDLKIKVLSGGQKKRLALAKILIDEPDFVILDEPTNHLDLDMIEWLEQFLQKSSLTLFMVTHDRYFLERVCNEIVELDKGKFYTYRGNYSDYLEKKTARTLNEAANLDKTKKLFSRELDWIRRQPKARGTKAKSRVDSFHQIKEKVKSASQDSELKIMVEPARMGSKILEAHALHKKYGERVMVDSFSYKFKKRERVGIVGPNGAGKTTFLKLLTKQLRPDGGKIVIGDTIKFGYYTQAGLQLEYDKRVIEVVRDIADYIPMAKGYKLTAEQLLERFLFPRVQQQVYVSQLSGGEKRRLYLLTILMQNPNFLILDEPTNDLDIITLNVLEEYLMDFPGCIIIVTHDRYFMDKIVDHLFVLEGDGQIKDYNGNYTTYRAEQHERLREEQRLSRENRNKDTSNVQIEAEKPKVSYEEQKEYKRLEKEIKKLEEKKLTLSEEFNDPSLTPEKIQSLSIELSQIQKSIEEKEERWFELAELIDA
jgi:ATP-binding cassette subfamily F protein uup